PRRFGRSDQDGLGINRDLRRITHHQTASIEGAAPTHAEITAVDAGLRQEARANLRAFIDALFPPPSRPLPQLTDPPRNFARDVPNSQLPPQNIVVAAGDIHLVSRESDLRIMLHVEEIGAAQVRVPIRIPGPDRAGVNARLHPGTAWILGIEDEFALDVLEVPADVANHHVADAELGRRMAWFEKPFRHSSLSMNQDSCRCNQCLGWTT